MAYFKLLVIVILTSLINFSCNRHNPVTIETLNDLAGNYEGLEINKNDTLNVSMSFNGGDLKVVFSSQIDEYTKPLIELSYTDFRYNKVNKDTLKIKPTKVFANTGGYKAIGSEIFIDDYSIMPYLKIIQLKDGNVLINYDLKRAVKQIKNRNEDFYLTENLNGSYEVKKITNPKSWWYFNPYTSLPITDADGTSIEVLIDNKLNATNSFKLTSHKNFEHYFKLANYSRNSNKDKFLKPMTSNGSFFQGDFNSDGLQDIGCYYSQYGRRIYFFIYLNNGIDYDMVYKVDLYKEKGEQVFTKAQLKGKDVIQINYVNGYITNYLYFNKLKNKFEIYFTD